MSILDAPGSTSEGSIPEGGIRSVDVIPADSMRKSRYVRVKGDVILSPSDEEYWRAIGEEAHRGYPLKVNAHLQKKWLKTKR